MKTLFLYLGLTITLICCGSSNKSLNISPVLTELSGIVLGDTVQNELKLIEQENISAQIFFHSNDKYINEMDIYLSSKFDSSYLKLLGYYNLKFNTEYQDTLFNTWQTDSTEFILYKNSDSSILVNIFKRQ